MIYSTRTSVSRIVKWNGVVLTDWGSSEHSLSEKKGVTALMHRSRQFICTTKNTKKNIAQPLMIEGRSNDKKSKFTFLWSKLHFVCCWQNKRLYKRLSCTLVLWTCKGYLTLQLLVNGYEKLVFQKRVSRVSCLGTSRNSIFYKLRIWY